MILLDLKQKYKPKQLKNENVMKKIKKIVIIVSCSLATLTGVQQVLAQCGYNVAPGSNCGISLPATPSACIATTCPTNEGCTGGNEDSSCTNQAYTASCTKTQYQLHSEGIGSYCGGTGQPLQPVSGGPCQKVAASSSGC